MNILSARPIYDVTIWEEIRTSVRWKIDALVQSVRIEISKDASLAEFQGKQPVPWQLTEIMQQRADGWLQRLYNLCCDAYKTGGKTPSEDFDRAVWAFCIEPFIMDGDPERLFSYTGSGLLQLLLIAVGSPPEKRNSLKVNQKDCCLGVRAKLWETWRDKLLHMPPRINEAIAAIARANALEARAARIARGLPPDPVLPPTPAPESPQTSPLAEPLSPSLPPLKGCAETTPVPNNPKPATWGSVQISFLSDERVQIFDGTSTETCNYAEFGFEDGRNGKPNQAWEILRTMAVNRGTLPDGSKAGLAWPKVEKAVQEIRKALHRHFGIPADPIPFVKGVGYRACFKIGCSPSFHT